MANEVIQPMSREIIQIWDYHPAISIEHLLMHVQDREIFPDKGIESRVNANWEKTLGSNPSARDQKVAYLASYSRNSEILMEVFMSQYKYNQWFNLDDTQMSDTREAIKLGLTPITSWMLVLSKNRDTALFGRKINYGAAKVSGFGGYITLEDLQDASNLYMHTKKKIAKEIGDIEIAS